MDLNKVWPICVALIFTAGTAWAGAEAASVMVKVNPTQQPGTTWHDFSLNWREQQPSVWDFSADIETPAGKHGFLRTEGAHFVVGTPSRRIRLWGVNISGPACFPSHEESPRIASFLRRWGFNAVRLSHFDANWANGIIDYKNKSRLAFNDEKFDRFFFFLAELKKNGIYYVIDGRHDLVFSTEEFKYLDSYWNRSGSAFLMTFSPALQRYFEEYTTELLSRKNPYTGLSLANDPALAGFQMLNETFLAKNLKKVKTEANIPAPLRQDFQRAWDGWTKDNGISGSYDSTTDNTIRERFHSWLERRNFQRLYTFFRHRLKLQCPLASTSCYVGTIALPSAADGDYTEGHAYYSHPKTETVEFEGKKLQLNGIESSPAYIDGNFQKWLPFMLSQRIGYQPYVVGEWNNCVPEGFDGPLMAATIGGIQDFDGMFMFNLAQSDWDKITTRNIGMFVSIEKPSIMVNMILAALAWHRNAIPPAADALAVVIPENDIFPVSADKNSREERKQFGQVLDAEGHIIEASPRKYSLDAYSANEFLFRLFCIPATPGIKEPPAHVLRLYHARKSTEQKKPAQKNIPIRIARDKAWLDTPDLIAVWGRMAGADVVGNLQVKTDTPQDFSVSAIALDRRPLTDSKKILIAIGSISYAKNTVLLEKRRSDDSLESRYILNKSENEPVYRVVNAEISYNGKGWSCYAVSNTGVKGRKIAAGNEGRIFWRLGKDLPNLFFLLERP